MSQDDLFNLIDNAPPADDGQGPAPNAPSEFSVSEISQKLKSVVEDQFSYVRVRGELSRVTVAKSGHVYTALKDENATLDAICWRGTAGRLSITPEEGLDVIVTGRLTTYPGRSNYQIIIESMELAGEGALLKMLEDRRKKLAAEGLFDDARKRPIPYIPNRIGVITSPTGAVIRDIMHRLMDRFPRPVYLWPAVVQGDQAAAQIIAGVQGFNALPDDSPYRPDVLIVARGGGSLEDLMPFNDECVVRAIAASRIPVICAVGHETDTSLADYAADLRAPTPTGAAEKAVPVRQDLVMSVDRLGARLKAGMLRMHQDRKQILAGLNRGLTHPRRLLEHQAQRLDNLSSRQDSAVLQKMSLDRQKLIDLGARIVHPKYILTQMRQRLGNLDHRLSHGLKSSAQGHRTRLNHFAGRLSLRPYNQEVARQKNALNTLQKRLTQGIHNIMGRHTQRLQATGTMLSSLSYERTLDRGYAIVRDENGAVLSATSDMPPGKSVQLIVKDGTKTAEIKD